jgi:hypothetical protein
MPTTTLLQSVITQDGRSVLSGAHRVVIGSDIPDPPPPPPSPGLLMWTGRSPGVSWQEREILEIDVDA